MAILKETPSPFGMPVKYWRIIKIETHFDNIGAVDVTLGGYIDGTARNEGFNPAAVQSVRLFLGDLPAEPTRTIIYEALASDELFKDALAV